MIGTSASILRIFDEYSHNFFGSIKVVVTSGNTFVKKFIALIFTIIVTVIVTYIAIAFYYYTADTIITAIQSSNLKNIMEHTFTLPTAMCSSDHPTTPGAGPSGLGGQQDTAPDRTARVLSQFAESGFFQRYSPGGDQNLQYCMFKIVDRHDQIEKILP